MLLYGRDISRDSRLATEVVAVLSQTPLPLHDLTVAEALTITGHLRGLSRHDARRDAQVLMERFDLGTVSGKRLGKLSGGQLRLAAFATAMIIALSPNLLAVVVLLLAPLTLCGVGALIGVLAPSQQVAAVITNVALVVVMFLSPVLAPASVLPGVLRLTAVLLPPTYAADALRRTLQGQANASVVVDMGVMALFAIGSIYLVTTRLDWRSR